MDLIYVIMSSSGKNRFNYELPLILWYPSLYLYFVSQHASIFILFNLTTPKKLW